MSISFDLIAHIPDKKRILTTNLDDMACFSICGHEDGLSSYVRNNYKYIRYVRYKPRLSAASAEIAHMYIQDVLTSFGFENFIPKQTASSVLRRGILIDGARISGPHMLALLSFIRYLHEEPGIMHSYRILRKEENMDPLGAVTLAHYLRFTLTHAGATHFTVDRSVSNSNHTVFTGYNIQATVHDIYNRKWLEYKGEPWTQNRHMGGIHKIFSPNSQTFDYDKQCKISGTIYDIKNLPAFLEKYVYSVRNNILNETGAN